MAKWKCPTDDEGATLLEAVAREMVSLFDIGEAEAVVRINDHWGHLSVVSDEEKQAVAHRTPDEWALMIYFGRGPQLEYGLWNRREFLLSDNAGLQPKTLSFTARPVTRWAVDVSAGRLLIEIGRTVDADPIRPPFQIQIGPFSEIRGHRKPLGEAPQAITDLAEPLAEVNEFGFGPPVVWVKGFGTMSGDWLHYEFDGPAQVV